MECSNGTRRKHIHTLFGVLVIGQDLARVPVISGLVVIPLHQLRHLRVEILVVLVTQVVRVAPAEFLQGFRYLGGFFAGQVVPNATVFQLYLFLDRISA